MGRARLCARKLRKPNRLDGQGMIGARVRGVCGGSVRMGQVASCIFATSMANTNIGLWASCGNSLIVILYHVVRYVLISIHCPREYTR